MTGDQTNAPAACPVLRINRYADALRFDRSQAILNAPEMFAAVAADPVNGEINVRDFLEGSVVFMDGARHRDRRKLLNQLLRPDSLRAIREDVILPAAERLLAERLEHPDDDGVYRMDLVSFCHRVFLHFTAKLIGLVGVDTEEGITALAELAAPIAAGTSSQFLQDRTAINEMALAAKARYVEQFYLPSRRACEAQLAKVERGEVSRDELPVNIMSFIVAAEAGGYPDEQTSIVETTMMFAASVGTSTQSIIQTLDFLEAWWAEHPEDRALATDEAFLLNALCETIRLRAPFSPYNTRMAGEDAEVAGHPVRQGQEIHIERVAANRDPTVFGPDAGAFNPHRPNPALGQQRYGLGFGSGPHQCFGLRVVLGIDGTGGAHVRLLRHLFEAGVARDPDNEPVDLKKDMDKFSIENIPRYVKYPVVFKDWSGRR
ncbi:MAG: cytochrome P450 [Acidimicrobiia bacterium]